jgi:glycosyltransferase involved in cell wall biosynthesis
MESDHSIVLAKAVGGMKVLFLTYCYPPQKYPRSIQISHLVQYLKKDFSVDVITSVSEGTGDESLLYFTPLDNVEYAEKALITKFIEKSRGHKIKKAILPDLYYPWHFDLYNTATHKIKAEGVDVIVTFGQPMSTHIAGLKLKEKFPRIKWVAHFSDPWLDNPFNEYNGWTKFVNRYYQNKVFRISDCLIFTSQDTIELIMKNYSNDIRPKSIHIPHCFNESLYSNVPSLEKSFTIRYLGNFYGDRQPDYLFKALKRIPEAEFSNIRIELIGASTSSVEECIKQYDLENRVFVLSSVSYMESLSLMKSSDLLLIMDAPFENSPFLPSKLVDYIGANKPIFGITPKGTSQKLIEEMGFLVAHPSNPDEIAEKLIKMIKSIQLKQLSGIPEIIRDRYSVRAVGQHMAEALYSVTVRATTCCRL